MTSNELKRQALRAAGYDKVIIEECLRGDRIYGVYALYPEDEFDESDEYDFVVVNGKKYVVEVER